MSLPYTIPNNSKQKSRRILLTETVQGSSDLSKTDHFKVKKKPLGFLKS